FSGRVAEQSVAAPLQAYFGGQHNLIATAPLGDRAPDDLLRVPEAVGGRSVDEIDPALERRMNRSHGFIILATAPLKAPPGPRPQADAAHGKRNVTNLCLFHAPRQSQFRAMALLMTHLGQTLHEVDR